MKIRMAVAEIFTGCIMGLLGLWFLVKSFQLNDMGLVVGPGAFPKIFAALAVALSLLVIFYGMQKLKDYSNSVEIKRHANVLGFVLLVLVYAALMNILGYFLTTAILFPSLLFVAGERKWKKLVFISAGFVVFAKVVFDILLGVPLP